MDAIFLVLIHQFSVFSLFQILFSPSPSPSPPAFSFTYFPPHRLLSSYLCSSFSLRSHFLNYYTSQAPQLPRGLIIPLSSIPCGWKTLQDCIFGPNPNLYCLYLGWNTAFSVSYKQGLCPGWITSWVYGKERCPLFFISNDFWEGAQLSANSHRGVSFPDEELL